VLRSDPEKVRAWQQRSRTNLARTPLVAARKAIPPRSPRKVERWKAVADASVAALVRDGYRCQAAGLLSGDCAGPLEAHHIVPRSTAPELRDVEANIIALCSWTHHPWVGDHPAEARRLGLHGHAGDDLGELARRRQRGLSSPSGPSERFP
jgi:5-methylcytosine-specific restriction endonuclease McrA